MRTFPRLLFSGLLAAGVWCTLCPPASAQSAPPRGGPAAPAPLNPSAPLLKPSLATLAAPTRVYDPNIDKTGAVAPPGALRAPFRFGSDYLRVSISDIYIPGTRGNASSVYATITTLNKTPLTFKYAFEAKPQQVFSARGEYMIIPFTALNTKAPLEIVLEQRTTRNASNSFGLIQGLLGTAAGAFTGGALGTISTLTRYATASNDLVQEYEARTQISDINRAILFDNADGDTIAVPSSLLAVFTGGQGVFAAVTADGKTHALKEMDVRAWVKADTLEEAKYQSPYKLRVDDSGTFYYPKGDRAYVVLRLTVYTPYPNLDRDPEQVAATRDSFRVLDAVFAQHPEPTADDVKARQVLITAEGDRLFQSLGTLTDAGDLSLADAHSLLLAFVRRASHYGGRDTRYDGSHLQALAADIGSP